MIDTIGRHMPKNLNRDKRRYNNELIGRTIKALTVIRFARSVRKRSKSTPSNHRGQLKRRVLCKCVCGRKCVVGLGNFIRGNIGSCGCRAKINRSNKNGWTGYGELSGSFYTMIRWGARARKLSFQVSKKYLWGLFLEQDRKCKLTGVLLKFPAFTTGYGNQKTASLDRIDSSKGYVKGNVQWVHKDINYMKQDMSEDTFIKWCQKVVDHQ